MRSAYNGHAAMRHLWHCSDRGAREVVSRVPQTTTGTGWTCNGNRKLGLTARAPL